MMVSRWEEEADDTQVLERFQNALANALDARFLGDEHDYGVLLERQFSVVHGSPYGALSNIRSVLYDTKSRTAMALALDHLLEAAAQLPTPYRAPTSPLDDVANAVAEALKHHPGMRLRLVKLEDTYAIHSAGVPDLDEAVIDATVRWLGRYPAVQNKARLALRMLAEGNGAESLNAARTALEMLVRAVLGNSRSLENQIGNPVSADAPLLKWMRDKGSKPQTITSAQRIISSFTDFQNAWVKHPPASGTSFFEPELEFCIYLAFTLMRLITALT